MDISITGYDFNAADKALEYGYADQLHLLKDYKRFHTMSPKQAREFAFILVSDKIFIQ